MIYLSCTMAMEKKGPTVKEVASILTEQVTPMLGVPLAIDPKTGKVSKVLDLGAYSTAELRILDINTLESLRDRLEGVMKNASEYLDTTELDQRYPHKAVEQALKQLIGLTISNVDSIIKATLKRLSSN